jgi:hypothetical protein
LHRKIFRKKKHFLSTWAEPVGSTRTYPAHPRRPSRWPGGAHPAWQPWPPPRGRLPPAPAPHKRGGRPRAPPLAAPARAPLPLPPARRRPASCSRQRRRPWSPNRAGELANQPRLTRKIRPVPSSSARGEHTIAILSISSLRFASHPSPYSPGTLRICCVRGKFLCSYALCVYCPCPDPRWKKIRSLCE